ncbi:MAG: hypothetical protein WCL46_10785 [Chlorobium sp.]
MNGVQIFSHDAFFELIPGNAELQLGILELGLCVSMALLLRKIVIVVTNRISSEIRVTRLLLKTG